MPAGRFYIAEAALVSGAEIILTAEIAHQVRDVLRLTPGAMIHLLDGAGGEYPATLGEVSRAHIIAILGAREEGHAEPPARIILYQGMLKAAKFEWVLQKGTELGVATFVPLITSRAVAASEELGTAKRHRYERILIEAMEQCGGAHLPTLAAPQTLRQALDNLPANAHALIPWEGEPDLTLRAALHRTLTQHADDMEAPPTIALFIGPEGGFAADEVALARQRGARAVTLGRRILRAETAAMVAVTLALDALEPNPS
ncbi:MAG TPA: 16S rRNA (uracil(1498)-N(3))-methyltransferase [Ktedonobacterales bacterium]|nr:16S rRNA (uracil(1498)-N(3))-methyltransferase [Ktedonobacterales bacterium]